MTTIHPDVAWTAGDDWQINATLRDENGNPFVLVGPQIKWSLINVVGQEVLNETDASVIVTSASEGKCTINVPGPKTSPLQTGVYVDFIRIVAGGVTSTLSYGSIHVTADPWAAIEAAAAAARPDKLRVVA